MRGLRFPVEAGCAEPHRGGQVLKKFPSYIGLDVHKDTIAVAVADNDGWQPRCHGPIRNEPEQVRRLVGRLSGPGRRLKFCCEAGPCGYGLYRRLVALEQAVGGDRGGDGARAVGIPLGDRPGGEARTADAAGGGLSRGRGIRRIFQAENGASGPSRENPRGCWEAPQGDLRT